VTISSAIAILSALLAIVRTFTGWLADKQLLDAGSAQAVLKGLQDADDAISRATKARELVRLDAARNPSGVLNNDDGFKRPD